MIRWMRMGWWLLGSLILSSMLTACAQTDAVQAEQILDYYNHAQAGRVARAIEAYYADHHAYPTALGELSPDYLDVLPPLKDDWTWSYTAFKTEDWGGVPDGTDYYELCANAAHRTDILGVCHHTLFSPVIIDGTPTSLTIIEGGYGER